MRVRRLLHIAQLFALNSVPAWGLFAAEWSTPTALGLYWIENLLATALIALRIVLHRRLTNKRGHYRGEMTIRTTNGTKRTVRRIQGTFLSGYLTVAIPFTLAHGVFLAVLVFLMLPGAMGAEWQVDGESLRDGLLIVASLMLFDLMLDLPTLSSQPFAWVRRYTDISISRMMVVHLTILFGVAVLAILQQPRGLFAVFVILKTMADLSVRLPQYDPEEPPEWLVAMMRRLKIDEGFADWWRKEYTTRRRDEAEDELVVKKS